MAKTKSTAWNTKEDDAWLEPRLVEYKASKNNKILRDAFTKGLREDWLALHPVGDPSPELIEEHKTRPLTKQQEKQHSIAVAQAKARGEAPPLEPVREVVDEARAKVFAKEAMEDKVVVKLLIWYNNHTRTPKGQTGKRGTPGTSFLNLNPSSAKTASPIQAYYALNRSTFKGKIASAWSELKKASGGQPNVTWINFWNTWLKEGLEKEPKEVKNKVDAFRKTYSEHCDPTEPLDERNERFVAGVYKLPRTVRGAGQMIYSQTGWSTLTITGSPHPAHEGELKIVLAAEGKTTDGQTFEDWLGPKRRKKFNTWFSDFLTEKYGGADELEKWALVTDEVESEEEEGSRTDESSSSSSDSEDSDYEADGPQKNDKPKKTEVKDKNIEESGEERSNDGEDGKKNGNKGGGSEIEGNKADLIDLLSSDDDDKPKGKAQGPKNDRKAGGSGEENKGESAQDATPKPSGPVETPQPAGSPVHQPETVGDDAEMRPLKTPPPVTDEDPLRGLKSVPGMEATWDNLREASSNLRWRQLLRDFVGYESAGPAVGNLSTAKRPKAITDWIQSKKKAVIPSLPAKFPDQWAAWWEALQPKWRASNVGASSNDVPEDADWSSLHKGGKSGFYTVVVSLGWLVHRFPGHESVWELVEDVAWVLGKLRGLPMTSGTNSFSSEKKDPAPEPTFIGTSRKRALSEKASAADADRAVKRSKETKPSKKSKAKGGRK